MTRRINRRQFVQQTTLAGFGYWVAAGSTRAESNSPNERLRFACIGVGGKGGGDTDQVGQLGDIVALCDCDEGTLNAKAGRFPSAKKYYDYRTMFDEMAKNIDAVTVSTPDHTHAPASLMAMKLGKHVYCQKPLTHTVYEARLMRETAAKMKVATQMGNQGTAHDGLRRAVEIVRSGAIGPVREVHVWTNRPVWPQAPEFMARPKETPPVPANLHWDEFVGPAPMRPYNPIYHPFKWRGWWDFGTGALGDMGCHTANMAFMALNLDGPTSIEAEAKDVNSETCPTWARVVYEFPARGDLAPCKLYWYEGREGGRANKDGKRILPPAELLAKVLRMEKKKVQRDGKTVEELVQERLSDSGSMLVGDKGIMFSPNDYGADVRLLPEKEFADFKDPTPTLPRNGRGDPGMKEEWVAAIRGGQAAMSNFDYAGRLTETILLGNVAIRAGKKILWDRANLQATNCPEADQYIRTEYRKGWTT